MSDRRQGIFWILTIPHYQFTPYLPPGVAYSKGQLERGESGYLHWQLIIHLERKQSLTGVRKLYGDVHAELTNSKSAEDYVHKDETCVDVSTRFELGRRKLRRNDKRDWDLIRQLAHQGDFSKVDSDVYIRYYFALQRIARDNLRPVEMVRRAFVFWGDTGTGKTRKCWDLAKNAYPKDPCTKWWDGYTDQKTVIVDEFTGSINISHILRWTDRYPALVEKKGSTECFNADRILFTSNLHPREWYPMATAEQKRAIERRFSWQGVSMIFKFPLNPVEELVLNSIKFE